jgi:hypothetical protein
VGSDAILFDESIPAGTSKLILRKKMVYSGFVKEMTIVFYPGQQKTLQVLPYMEKAPDIAVPFTKFAGDRDYYSGDNSKFEVTMNMRFGTQDQLCVEVSNTSAFDYDLYVLFELVYGEGS